MAANKTQPTSKSAADFIAAITDEPRRKDAATVAKLMKSATGKPATMWGPAIVGFDSYHYVYESGREGDAPIVAFSPRKDSLVLYVLSGFPGQEALLKKLGKHKASGGCLHLKTLEGANLQALAEIITRSVAKRRKAHAR